MTIKRSNPTAILCQMVETDDTVYLAGITDDDKSGSIEDQTREVLARIERLLAQAGTDKSKIPQP